MRRFTKELKDALLKRVKSDLDKCWAQFGEDPRYKDLDEAFIRGYSITEGFESAIAVFRNDRNWTKQDEDFLNAWDKIWQDYRKKYFDARGIRDPYANKAEQKRHKI